MKQDEGNEYDTTRYQAMKTQDNATQQRIMLKAIHGTMQDDTGEHRRHLRQRHTRRSNTARHFASQRASTMQHKSGGNNTIWRENEAPQHNNIRNTTSDAQHTR